ncbi:hypothetical protein OG562_40900 [Streptomyces sp. NBC_01275]|nr:hypothetical protein [Streptomyces sp. NBC_01275]
MQKTSDADRRKLRRAPRGAQRLLHAGAWADLHERLAEEAHFVTQVDGC